jgi:exonuclease VII large subunit
MSSKEEKINEKNTAKYSNDNTINERTNRDFNNTLNQQQDAINKTLDNTLHNIRRATDEATREIPQYTQRITEYQEKTIQTIKDIASDVIEAQKQVVNSFQSQVDNNNSGNFYAFWDLYNPQRIAENNAAIVNNFTSYLLNASNLINTTLASNLRTYNTALEQTRDNLKTLTKTNTDYITSVNRYNSDINSTTQRTNRG